MNLRKDHYRSFTRTVRTVVVSSLLGVGLPPEAGRLLGSHPALADFMGGRERSSHTILCASCFLGSLPLERVVAALIRARVRSSRDCKSHNSLRWISWHEQR
ncbi:hypothetical protein OAO87_04535 [bacterium]|nr:hypothetical protein [bacterium]